MNPLIKAIGIWWLSGAKYAISRLLAGRGWTLPLARALEANGLPRAGLILEATTPDQVAAYFRGRAYWRPDPLWQGWDVVRPPVELLRRGGDDCDGMAMLHAQALEMALGRLGWRAGIVSYFADPWHKSHHFAYAVNAAGFVYAVQPQPDRDYPYEVRLVYGPYATVDAAVRAIAALYGVEVVWYDNRRPDWSPA